MIISTKQNLYLTLYKRNAYTLLAVAYIFKHSSSQNRDILVKVRYFSAPSICHFV